MGVKKFFRIWWVFISRNLQAKMTYKADFIIGILANILMQVLGFLTIWVVFSQIDRLAGWSYYEVLFMYGIASMSSGFSEFFLDGVWDIGSDYVRRGGLDRLLTRPMNPLLAILIAQMEPHGLGCILFGIAVCGYSGAKCAVVLGPLQILLLCVMVLCGALIYLAINLFMATFSFFVVKVTSAMVLVHDFNAFSKYPLPVYHKLIRIVLSWVIPFAFTSFYPAAMLLNKTGRMIGYFTPAMCIMLLVISYRFWKWGLSHYQSAGG